jgi:PAS domain S-box-containing protein
MPIRFGRSGPDVNQGCGHGAAGEAAARPAARQAAAADAAAHAHFRSEQDLRRINDTLPALIGQVDTELRLRYLNAYYRELLGDRASNAVGRTMAEVLGEDLVNRRRPYLERALAGETVRFDASIGTQLGMRLLTHVYTPERDPDGSVCGIFIFATDITDQWRTEQRLARSEAELSLVTDAVPAMISHLDRECRYLYINRAYREAIGRSADQLIGNSIRNYWGDALFEHRKPLIDRALAGETVHFEAPLRYRDSPDPEHWIANTSISTRAIGSSSAHALTRPSASGRASCSAPTRRARGGNDMLSASGDGNHLFGDAGGRGMFNDARGGNDVLTVVSTAGQVNELYGNAREMHDNTVGGNDTLVGGNDDDPIVGDALVMLGNAKGGNDQLWGDAKGAASGGADCFGFAGLIGRDVVHDFRPGEGDTIQLNGHGAALALDDVLDNTTALGGNTVIDIGAALGVSASVGSRRRRRACGDPGRQTLSNDCARARGEPPSSSGSAGRGRGTRRAAPRGRAAPRRAPPFPPAR